MDPSDGAEKLKIKSSKNCNKKVRLIYIYLVYQAHRGYQGEELNVARGIDVKGPIP